MLRRRRLKWILRIRIRAHSTFSVSALPQKSPTDAFSLVNTIREADSLVIWDSRTLFWLNIYFCEEKRKENPELSQTQCSSTLLSAGVQAQRRHIRRKIKKINEKRGDSAVSWQSDILSAGAGEAHNDMRNNHGTSHQSGGRHTEARTFDTIHRAQVGGRVGRV